MATQYEDEAVETVPASILNNSNTSKRNPSQLPGTMWLIVYPGGNTIQFSGSLKEAKEHVEAVDANLKTKTAAIVEYSSNPEKTSWATDGIWNVYIIRVNRKEVLRYELCPREALLKLGRK